MTSDLASHEDSTAVRRFFFRGSWGLESPVEVMAWWERRRLTYNAVVGAAGVATLTAVNVLVALGPGGRAPGLPPFAVIVAYATAANLAFTGGWIAELSLRRHFGRRTGTLGAALFRYGFVFAAGVTLLPIGFAAVDLIARVLRSI
jgi:hypothetical protein